MGRGTDTNTKKNEQPQLPSCQVLGSGFRVHFTTPSPISEMGRGGARKHKRRHHGNKHEKNNKHRCINESWNKNGKMHGQGTATAPDGAKYVGRFKDGKWHGQGTFTFADGGVLKGMFRDGEFLE